MPRWPLAVPAVLIVGCTAAQAAFFDRRHRRAGPERWAWAAAFKLPAMAPSVEGALRNASMPIWVNHGVMTVGMMMVRVLVTVVASPADAWIRPAATKPKPARTTTHPSQRG